MNCYFCNKTMPPESEKNMEESYSIWSCPFCPGEITMIYDHRRNMNKMTSAHIFYEHKYVRYQIVFRLVSNTAVILNHTKADPILRLNFLPDITPHNVHKKLPVYLTFI